MVTGCNEWQEQLRKEMQAVQLYTWERIGDHDETEQRKAIASDKAARLLNVRFVKQQELSIKDINLLLDPFLFVTAEVIGNLVLEKDQYYIAVFTVGVGYGLWDCWRDNRLGLPHSYDVAKDIALIQPSSTRSWNGCFLSCVLCMEERQERNFSYRIAASALLKYNRGRVK